MEPEQIAAEYEANRILREAGAFRAGPDGAHDCYTDDDLVRRTFREIDRGVDVPWAEDYLLAGDGEPPRVTLAELMPYLTRTQRRYVRLMQRLGSQQAVANHLGLRHRSAVSHVLARAYLRIRTAFPLLQAREPEGWAWALFLAELRRKKRLVYRRPTAHLGWHEQDARRHRER